MYYQGSFAFLFSVLPILNNGLHTFYTGISQSNLSILERHLTYSLSHEKTTTQIYIMKYGRALNEELTEVAIEDVIRRSVHMWSSYCYKHDSLIFSCYYSIVFGVCSFFIQLGGVSTLPTRLSNFSLSNWMISKLSSDNLHLCLKKLQRA